MFQTTFLIVIVRKTVPVAQEAVPGLFVLLGGHIGSDRNSDAPASVFVRAGL